MREMEVRVNFEMNFGLNIFLVPTKLQTFKFKPYKKIIHF